MQNSGAEIHRSYYESMCINDSRVFCPSLPILPPMVWVPYSLE